MSAIPTILKGLAESPVILWDLVRQIPEPVRHEQRRPGKWTIHENACHLAVVEPMMYDRLLTFKNVDYPVFQAYLPGTNVDDTPLSGMNLEEELDAFTRCRAATIKLAQSLSDKDWKKEATHPEYDLYTAEILLRHLLLHDGIHMFRIQQLWLTKPGFLE